MSQDSFDETQAAYAKVQETILALRSEYEGLCAEIKQTEATLAELPVAPVPFGDLKEAVIELVEASGQRYAERYVKKAISTFATGGMLGLQDQGHALGKPLGFREIERAIGDQNTESGRAQFASYAMNRFDDGALYFFFGDLVKAGLRRIMDEMTPADFGYGAIHPDKVGTGLAERRLAIDETRKSLDGLLARRADVVAKLRGLGHHIAPTIKH